MPPPVASRGGPTEAQILFRHALGGAMRREWVTDAITAANVAVFLMMVISGVSALLPTAPELVGWGANFAPLTRRGDWWRLFSSMFVHGGLIHLGFNTYALLMVGRMVERVYGHVGYALLYLFAGLTGSAASALIGSVPSVGASGAIFGVFGALLAFLLRRRALVPMQVLARLRSAVLTFVLFNVAFGFAVPGIDNAAHLGGLAGGFVAGIALAPDLHEARLRRPWALFPVVVLLGAAVVWLVGFTDLMA